MQTESLSSLLLVGLVVLSGCSGFPGPETSETEQTTDVSPPYDGADSSQPNSPPGVRDGRLVNPEQLLDQHWSILSYSTYSAERHYTEQRNSSQSVQTNVTVEHASDGRYRATVVSTQGLSDRDEYWFDGELGYLATTIGNETRYTRAQTARGSTPLPEDLLYFATPPYRSGVVNQRGLYQYITAARGSTLETIERDNESDTLFRLSTQLSDPDDTGSAARFDSIRNGSFTAVVDSWGVVHSYQLSYEAVVGGRIVKITENVSYELNPETNVTPPAWINHVDDENESENSVLSRAS
ncbi:hypothetical protein [Salinibaculum salinum]|uniref:hypothetical protein n=1 Tax=Salinibaculum salinum TaxID=3131996 RepID=UPI0030EC6567